MGFSLLATLSGQLLAQTNIPEDPFGHTKQTTTSAYQHDLSLLAYYQHNNINEENILNPNLVKFSDIKELSVLDWKIKANWQNNIQGRARTIGQYQKNGLESSSDIKVLEAYLSWTSDDYAWQWQVGRIKTQWSNGFNWNLTNLLKPYRDRPYIDLDDPNQQQGWDMASVRYTRGQWFYNLLVADYDSDTTTRNQQYIARLGYQGSNDYALIIHKLPNQRLNYAASFSRLLNDAITFRFEWSLLHQREQQTQILLAQSDSGHWQKYLFGGAYTFASGSNFRIEYLNTAHGFTTNQWQEISNKSVIANSNITTGQGRDGDYNYLGAALNSLNYGQLRENYLYLIFSSPQSNKLWQYRQSIQLNLDDNSQLHRLELLKSWNNHLTSRLQFEVFNGCQQCEYGLNPNENSIRLVVNWTL